MIPQEIIEQVRQASDIVQIIGEFVRLKKRGKNYIAPCPFHTEKTPSFIVSQDKQIYHCFGCGKGGNGFTFLMEHEKMSFVEAVKHLAHKAGITIVEDKQSDYKRELFDRLNYSMSTAVEYFQKVLISKKYEHVLNKYLKGKRNISEDAIEFFKLGLAGEEWEGLIQFSTKKDIKIQDMDEAGLVSYSEKTKKHFDRFRQRLMIPIMNLSGKPIGFGGRTLKKGEPAKYMNSPETKLYFKSNVLYNLNLAKDSIRKENSVLIVEGYFDVISLWDVGIKNVVASSGTAFTAQQARLLARFTEEVYLFFDADSAGKNAALRSVDSLYDAGLEVKIIVPPEGEDPDSLAQKYGRDKIDDLKAEAIGFIPFRIIDFDKSSAGIISKEKLIKEFSAIGSKINDPTRRALFFTEAAEQMGVDQQIFQQSGKIDTKEPPSPLPRKKRHNMIETNFLSLMFNNPGSLEFIFEKISPDDFDSKELSRLFSAITAQFKDTGVIDARSLIDNINDIDFVSLIAEVAAIEWEKNRVEEETRVHVKLLLEEKLKRVRLKLKHELAEAEKSGNQDRAMEIVEEMRSYGLDAKKLKVENLALMESVTLEFDKGLTVLTGETGAGKSVIVNAISLALGGRGEREHIRFKADSARIEATFDISKLSLEYKKQFSEYITGNEIIIFREISRSGKSKIKIGGIPSSLNELKETASSLAEILGQHANQQLMHEENHLDFLDRFASLGSVKSTVSHKFNLWKSSQEKFDSIRRKRDRILKERELLTFQKNEIGKAKISIGEEEEMLQEKKILDSTRMLMSSANLIKDVLDNEENSVTHLLNLAQKELDKMSEVDRSLEKNSEELTDLIYRLGDLKDSIDNYGANLNDNPFRIEEINQRLDEIYNLKKKYGGSEESILAALVEIQNKLDDSPPDIDRYLETLQEEVQQLFESYSKEALSLSDTRKKAADYLQKLVIKELKDLSIDGAGFEMEFLYEDYPGGVIINDRAVKPTANGLESGRILFSANKGEPLKSLVKTASGGEISRILLSLKSAEKKNIKKGESLMVFDEVDAGIGGMTAIELGKKLKKLSAGSQLLVITHLHQIAREADAHFIAEKTSASSGKRTIIKVQKLSGKEIAKELKRMVSLPE